MARGHTEAALTGLSPEAAVRHAVANAALDGHELDVAFVNRLHDVATGRTTAEALISEIVHGVTEGEPDAPSR